MGKISFFLLRGPLPDDARQLLTPPPAEEKKVISEKHMAVPGLGKLITEEWGRVELKYSGVLL